MGILNVQRFKFTKPKTLILIEFYCENSFCTDFQAYTGLFDQVEKINTLDIVYSTNKFMKYEYIDHELNITEYDKNCVVLYGINNYIQKYDIYTGKNAEKRIEFYKNLNLFSKNNKNAYHSS